MPDVTHALSGNLLGTTTLVFTFEGHEYAITEVSRRRDEKPTKKSRLYFSESRGLHAQRMHDYPLPAPKIKGEDPENDRAYKVHNRAVVALQKQALQLLVDRGVVPTLLPATFSRYAGCSCPCSPGWILEGTYGWNYWVNVTLPGEVDPWGVEANKRAKAQREKEREVELLEAAGFI